MNSTTENLLATFERDLRELVTDPRLRPFVCEGNPFACKVFVVGYNPATTLDDDFWTFWRKGHGYDKQRWLESYKAARQERGKPAMSNTRERLSRIEAAATYVSILETNVISYSAQKPKDIPISMRVSNIFEFLFDRIKPKLVLTHGARAMRLLDKLGVSYVPESGRHLSRWSYDKANEFGRSLNRSVG